MDSCLQKANEKRFCSLALPALGCGRLNYPARIVAQAMVLRIREFQRRVPSTSIKEVMFVVPLENEDIYKVMIGIDKKTQLTFTPTSIKTNLSITILTDFMVIHYVATFLFHTLYCHIPLSYTFFPHSFIIHYISTLHYCTLYCHILLAYNILPHSFIIHYISTFHCCTL